MNVGPNSKHKSESVSCSVLSDSLLSPGLLCPWNSPDENTGVVLFPSPGGLPNPEMEPGSPTLQASSLLSEPSEKPQ